MFTKGLRLARRVVLGALALIVAFVLVVGNDTILLEPGARFAIDRPSGSLVVHCTASGLYRNEFVPSNEGPRYVRVRIGPFVFGTRDGLPVMLFCPTNIVQIRP